MDHKVSKDMISSGMIPSGEKTQADLGRTQYGSAPSPNKLMDAYKSMYEHHQKDKDGNTIPHEDDVKEGKEEGSMISNVSKALIRNKRATGDTGSTEPTGGTGQGISSAAKMAVERGKEHKDRRGVKTGAGGYTPGVKTEGVDLFDVISDKLIEEGYSKKESYEIMANLTKEQLEEINEAVVSGTLATLGLIGTKLLGGAKVAAAAAGKGLTAGKALAAKGLGAAKTAATAGAKKITSAAKTGMSKATDALGKVSNIAKPKGNKQLSLDLGKAGQSKPTNTMGDTMTNMGKSVRDEVKDEIKRKILQGNDGGSNKITKTGTMSAGSYQAASADLFDIVKGQLLDEGLSEEEIKDIMLTLTPDEILKEIEESSMSGGEGDDRHMGTDNVARSKEQIGNMFNKNIPAKRNNKVDKVTRKAINTSARDLKIQGPTTLNQSVEPKGETI